MELRAQARSDDRRGTNEEPYRRPWTGPSRGARCKGLSMLFSGTRDDAAYVQGACLHALAPHRSSKSIRSPSASRSPPPPGTLLQFPAATNRAALLAHARPVATLTVGLAPSACTCTSLRHVTSAGARLTSACFVTRLSSNADAGGKLWTLDPGTRSRPS